MELSTNSSLDEAILARLGKLRSGTSLCPGQLARELGLNPRALRSDLIRLQRQGRVRVTQGGQGVDLATARGPYRVAPGERAERESSGRSRTRVP
ncbi:MAG: DUF3253 domain-containing protein [Verrucomicrobiia bacterium]